MSEEERDRLERAIARAFRPQRRLSRRNFLRQAGKGGAYAAGALSLPAILAACGIGPTTTSPAASTAASAGQSAAATPSCSTSTARPEPACAAGPTSQSSPTRPTSSKNPAPSTKSHSSP